jgi:hypothetical protein
VFAGRLKLFLRDALFLRIDVRPLDLARQLLGLTMTDA